MKNKRDTQIVTWRQICNEVKAVNPALFEIIDQLPKISEYPLLKARYCFGDIIVDHGTIQIPQDNELLNKERVADPIHNLLDYSAIPLILLLNNTSEVFQYNQYQPNQTLPMNVCHSGTLLGTFEVVDYWLGQSNTALWNVSAGIRTLLTLPNIYEDRGINRLKNYYKFNYNFELKSSTDHWNAFVKIANSVVSTIDWYQDIIIFTRSWFDKKNLTLAWLEFKDYIFKIAWQQSQHARTKFQSGLMWQKINQLFCEKNLLPLNYAVDIIKNLLTLSQGHSPGLAILSDKSEHYAPINIIKHALVDVYGLKRYSPTLMAPAFLTDNNIIFYSLNFSNLYEGSHIRKKSSTLMSELRQIKYLIEKIEPYISDFLPKQVQFNFFHNEKDKLHEIKHISEVIKQLGQLERLVHQTDKPFCCTSSFWRGCVAITLKRKN